MKRTLRRRASHCSTRRPLSWCRAHHLPGRSFWQAFCAAWNCGERGSRPDPAEIFRLTLPPGAELRVGEVRLAVRAHAGREGERVAARLAPAGPGSASRRSAAAFRQACWAFWNCAEPGSMLARDLALGVRVGEARLAVLAHAGGELRHLLDAAAAIDIVPPPAAAACRRARAAGAAARRAGRSPVLVGRRRRAEARDRGARLPPPQPAASRPRPSDEDTASASDRERRRNSCRQVITAGRLQPDNGSCYLPVTAVRHAAREPGS